MTGSAIWLRTSVIGVAVAAMAACGSSPSSTDASPTASPPSGQSAVTTSPTSAEAGTVIEISIANGAASPTNAEVQAGAGEPIVLQVSSDAVDSLHVHSVPEHVYDVEARPNQRFEFTVDIPGRVAVELHDLHVTVVTIEVRP